MRTNAVIWMLIACLIGVQGREANAEEQDAANPFEAYLASDMPPVEKPVLALAVAVCEEQLFTAMQENYPDTALPLSARLQQIRARDFSRMFHAASYMHLKTLLDDKVESVILPFHKQTLKTILKAAEYQKHRNLRGFLKACYQAAEATEAAYAPLVSGTSSAELVDMESTVEAFAKQICEAFQYGLLQHNPQIKSPNVSDAHAAAMVQELAKAQALLTYMLGEAKTRAMVQAVQYHLRKYAEQGALRLNEAEAMCHRAAQDQVARYSSSRMEGYSQSR